MLLIESMWYFTFQGVEASGFDNFITSTEMRRNNKSNVEQESMIWNSNSYYNYSLIEIGRESNGFLSSQYTAVYPHSGWMLALVKNTGLCRFGLHITTTTTLTTTNAYVAKPMC